jgi:hypothetical protein
MTVTNIFKSAFKWFNDNQGVVSVAIFLFTIGIGWTSGIFSALRRKPKFKITLIPGPTFCCTYPVGKKYGDFDVHRTGMALYLIIANIGSAPSSIENISIGYHWHIKPFSLLWFKYRLGWFWLCEQTAVLADFQSNIGDHIKIYPFLIQKSILSGESAETFLEVGQSTSGVVYFEQGDSWGGCFPTIQRNSILLKIRVRDVFSNCHCSKFSVPVVSFEAARKYNPSFGKTLAELHNDPLPYDSTSQ